MEPQQRKEVEPILGVADFVVECAEPLFEGTLSGRELTKKLLKTTILSEDLADDLQETLEEGDSKDIDETVFAQIALLLPILYLFNHLPYCVISFPMKQSISNTLVQQS